MPDREQTPEQGIERELRSLGRGLEYPPTPDLARTVRQRLEESERPAAGWSRLGFPALSPRWAAAAAVLLLLIAIPVFSSAARDTLFGPFGAGGGAVQSSGEPLAPDQGTAETGASASDEGSDDAGLPDGESDGDFDRKVIKSADLGVRVEEVRPTVAEAQQVAAQAGGSVQSSQVDQGDGSVSAELVLSVPAPEFEETLDELRDLGEVTTDAVNGEDVTEEFVDLESRERNLLAAERSLLKLYDEAQSVDDALAVGRELAEVRGQIEQVQGRIQYLEQRTDFSRINLSIQPTSDSAASLTGWAPTNAIDQAWSASLVFLQTLASVFLSIVVFGWWLAPVLVAAFVWWKRRSREPGPGAPDSP